MSKREDAIKKLMKILNTFDPTGYNAKIYKETFSKMSDAEFKRYMQDILDEKQFFTFEYDESKYSLTMDKIFECCDKLGYQPYQHVMYRDDILADGMEVVSPTKALIIYIPVKRLVQMVAKKNNSSGNDDIINAITGSVTSDSKAAGMSDTQLYGFITTDLNDTVKEMYGPRADDPVSSEKMIAKIENEGNCKLSDLTILSKNKQSYKYMLTLLRSVMIDARVKNEDEED